MRHDCPGVSTVRHTPRQICALLWHFIGACAHQGLCLRRTMLDLEKTAHASSAIQSRRRRNTSEECE